MQMRKAGVVAIGAIASVTAMGAPAIAAPSADATGLARVTLLNMINDLDTEPQAFVVAGTGSAILAALVQNCAGPMSNGIGGVVDLTPDFLFGACNNANVKLKQDTVAPAIGALNDTGVVAAAVQNCAGDMMNGIGGTVSLNAAHMSFAPCRNGNVVITGEDEYTDESVGARAGLQKAADTTGAQQIRSAWAGRKDGAKPTAPRSVDGPRGVADLLGDTEPQAFVSALSGSAVLAALVQNCAGAMMNGIGGVIPISSPHLQAADCDNGNVKITQDDPTAAISALDNTAVLAAIVQNCAGDMMNGIGGVINVQSKNIMLGDCNNGNVEIS